MNAKRRTKYESVKNAARRPGLSPAALRARLRRMLETAVNGMLDLGGGIRAFKFGRTWRIAFPESDEATP